jgi:hypothetical protein
MRLSDAGLRQRQTKALNPNHQSPPWLSEDAAPRSLEPLLDERRKITNQQYRYRDLARELDAPNQHTQWPGNSKWHLTRVPNSRSEG